MAAVKTGQRGVVTKLERKRALGAIERQRQDLFYKPASPSVSHNAHLASSTGASFTFEPPRPPASEASSSSCGDDNDQKSDIFPPDFGASASASSMCVCATEDSRKVSPRSKAITSVIQRRLEEQERSDEDDVPWQAMNPIMAGTSSEVDSDYGPAAGVDILHRVEAESAEADEREARIGA